MKRIPLHDLANRISLSAVRRHGVARYVAAVLAGAVALAGAAFGAYALTVEPLALIVSDGYALPGNDVADALDELAATGKGAKDIEPVRFKAGDALWSGFTGLTVGEGRTPIASDFPLFVNDGAVVQMHGSDDTLITRTYDELDAYLGMIVSEGRAYTETGEAADADTYRFLEVRDGVYVVLQSMRLSAQELDETLPCGSIVAFTESAVACFRLQDGVYTASRMTVFPQATYVSFGADHEDEQTYDALLRGLGLLSDASTQNAVEPGDEEDLEKSEATEKKEAENRKTADVQPGDGAGVEAPAAQGDGAGEAEQGEWEWAKPRASASGFAPSVYRATTTLAIQDPAGVVSRPVRFEFRRAGQLYLRASFTAGGEVTVQGLEPNTTYDVIGLITYRNRAGQEAEEEFFSQSITTGDPSSLDPMKISFAQGPLHPERLEFADIAFAGGSDELLSNASGLSFEVDGKSFALSAQLRAGMLAGEKVSLKTSASFESNTTYEATLAATDRYGNVLPLSAPAVQMRTCKDKPKARLHVEKNEANNLVIGVDLLDANGAISGEAQLNLYDDAGQLIESKPLETGSHNYAFGELGYERVLRAKVVAGYDLDDGKGMAVDQEIGSMDFTTVSISVLGYAVYATTVSDVADTSATLTVGLNTKQMDARLVQLLTHGSVSAGLEGKRPVFTHQFTSKEVDALRAGEKLQFRMTGFDSKTTYKISTTAGAQIGDEQTGVYNEVKATNRVDSFKTLRHPALAEFSQTVVMSDEILFNARVLDIDGAVGKNVMLEMRDRFGRLVGEQVRFDAVATPEDDGWQEFAFKDLEEDQPYTVNVIPYDYNQGFDNGTLQGRTVLYTGEIITKNGVSGDITLRGVDAVDGDDRKLDVRARVEIADMWNELNPHQFAVEVLRNGEVVDTLAAPFSGTSDTVDLDPYRIDRSEDTYTLRLVVELHGRRVELSEVEFSAEHELIGIADEQDLKTLPRADKDGHFIVLDDITTTASNVTATSNADRFEGSIDFQGYTITMNRATATPDNPGRSALISHLGEKGVLKNAVLVVDGTPTGSLVDQCYGTVSNVKVTLKSPGATDVQKRRGLAGIINAIGPKGVLENFAVNLGGEHMVTTNSGGAVSGLNNGTVRNGYVYGGSLVVPNGVLKVTFEQVGGAIGWAEGNSVISNVMTMVDVVAPTDNESIEFGLVVGRRNACMATGLLATGNLVNYYKDGGNNKSKYGPVIGSAASSINARNKNIYYLNGAPAGAGDIGVDGSVSVSPLALYDREWYAEYLDRDGSLDTSPVLRECYPQVKFPSVMGAQDYIPLPERPEVRVPTVTSLRVLERGDAEATIQVSFHNPDGYKITGLEVAGALCDVTKEEQKPDIDDPTITRVNARVHVGKDQQHLSEYSLVGMTYELYGGKQEHETYKAGEYLIDIEFWRTISSLSEWKSLEGSSENFRLKCDLDFAGVTNYKDVQIGVFNGKLDGRGHALRNISIEMSYVFGTLKNSTIENLNVDGLELNNKDDVAFISRVYTGSTVDNVHISDVQIVFKRRVGVLAHEVNGASVITNCSISDATLTLIDSSSWNEVYAGGLAAFATGSTISNCYVQDMAMDVREADVLVAAGGLVGQSNSTMSISQCYAVGSIEASQGNIGGIVGAVAGAGDLFFGVWSDVDITTARNNIGGLAGEVYSGSTRSMPSLSLGDVYTSAVGVDGVGHVYGGLRSESTVISDAYYYENQTVAGLDHEDGAPLSYDQLLRADTYVETIGMTSFDTSAVGDGILPKLLDTNGKLIPGQRDVYIVEPGSVRVTSVKASRPSNEYVVRIEIDHSPGDKVVSATFDWLEPKGDPVVNEAASGHSILQYESVKPLRAYDTYRIDSIEFERGGKKRSQRVAERVYFGDPVYNTVANLKDWLEIDPDTYENYLVTGDIDFTGVDYRDANFGVKVNRLDGATSSEGSVPVIRGIKATYDTKKGGCSLIDTVRSSLSNLSFADIFMETDGVAEPYMFGPSIVKLAYGSGEDAELGVKNGVRNVSIEGATFKAGRTASNGRRSAYRMGMISRLDGDIDGAKVKDVRVEAKTDHATPEGAYYGSLFGTATLQSTVRNVDASGIVIDVSGIYAGGIGGNLGTNAGGYAENITVSNTKVTAGYSNVAVYAGGAFGSCYRTDNVTVTGKRDDVDGETSTVMVVTPGNYSGGIVGSGHVQNAHVSGVVVRAGTRAGGMTGTGSVNNWAKTAFDPATASTVSDCVVKPVEDGLGDYFGGAIGTSNSDSKNLYVTDVAVEGHNYVGGYAGHLSRGQSYLVVEDSTVTGTGEYAGGIAGYGYITLSGVKNVTVTGGARVGGITGYTSGGGFCYVAASRVSGNTAVGGAIGELNGRANSALAHTISVEADVMSHAGSAGGIVGKLAPEYFANSTNANFSTSIFKGTVTATGASGMAGGVFGEVVSGFYQEYTYGFMVAGNIAGPQGASGVVVGANTSPMGAPKSVKSVFAHSSTRVNGRGFADDEALRSSLGCDAVVARVVNTADITIDPDAQVGDVKKDKAYLAYVNGASSATPGLYFSTGYWEIPDSISSGSFPRPKSNYENGVRVVGPLQPAIEVPMDGSTTTLAENDGVELPSAEMTADLDVYASGVNTFNIEFPVDSMGQGFEIVAIDVDAEEDPSNDAEETGASSDAAGAVAGASDDDPAVTAGDGAALNGIGAAIGGVDSVRGGLAAEDAAADSGVAAELVSDSVDTTVSGTLRQRTYTFVWDYITPLMVKLHGADGTHVYRIDPAEVMRAAAVWGETAYWIAADGIHGLDDSLVEGSFVNLYDGRALTSDGSVVDIADDALAGDVASLDEGAVVQSVAEPAALASGDGWRTFWSYTEVEGGAERDMRLYPCGGDVYGVSAELDTVADGYVLDDAEDTHYRTVLMADGTLRDLADPLVYPDGFDNEGIASMTNTSAADVPLVVVRYDSGLMVCFDYTTGEVKFTKQGSGEDLGLLEYAGEFLDGLLGGLSDTDEVSGGDSGYGDALALEESASHGGLVGLDADGAAGSGAGESADGGSNGSPAGSSGVGSASTGAGSAAGGFASGTDYVSVYEPSSGGYVTYAVDALLNGKVDGVTSVNEACGVPASGGGSVTVTTQAPAQLGAAGIGQAGQVALFSSAVLGILAILLFI